MLDKKYPFVLCFLKVLPNNRPRIAQKTKDIKVGSYFCASNHQESSEFACGVWEWRLTSWCVVYLANFRPTGCAPSGFSVCCHMKRSFFNWACKAACSSLILPLKPDLAADLWLTATTSSITLLTCVCGMWERKRLSVSASQQDETVFKLSAVKVSFLKHIIRERDVTCVDELAHALVHPSLITWCCAVSVSDRHGVKLLVFVTAHLCGITSLPLSDLWLLVSVATCGFLFVVWEHRATRAHTVCSIWVFCFVFLVKAIVYSSRAYRNTHEADSICMVDHVKWLGSWLQMHHRYCTTLRHVLKWLLIYGLHEHLT